MSTRSHGLDASLHAYLVERTVVETSVQRRLRAETAERFDAEMQIAPEQGQFFRFLVRAMGVRRALEIGTFTGYSALAIAMELPEDGHLDCLDVSEEFTALARRAWVEAGVAAKITLRLGPGLDTLDRMIASGAIGDYDFVFVDADKEGYPAYYERAMRLLRSGGIACFDNTLWSGAIADPEVVDPETLALRELNRIAFEDPAVLACLVPIGDGLTMVWKR
jgi:caffeoyl-CoA O-methyltransferase